MKREEYEERMKDSKYRELTVTNCDDGKDYVFISYRGNSWKKVLTEIVYTLQKKYGLRVYFDKEFSSKNNTWIEQLIDNMDSSHCKACLCFFDEGYVTSYATLLELMHAMNPRSNLGNSIFPISFPIDWDKLSDEDWNTGLGVEDPDNPLWEDEKRVFDFEFKLIKKRYDVEAYYPEGAELRGCDCKNIMKIIQPKNKREYVNEEAFYNQFIVEPLKKKCPEVFEEIGEFDKYDVVIINGEKKSTLRIKDGDLIPEQDPGIREGFKFEGWFVSRTDKEWNFDNPVNKDIEIYARWKETTFPIIINEKTLLKDFEKLCERVDFCEALGKARGKTQHGGKGLFDYLMAALLRGCDADIYDKKNHKVVKLSAYNYNKYAVAENPDDPKTSDIQYPWTWTTNCRKALKKEDIPERFINEKGKVKSGKLEDFNTIFEALDSKITIGDVLDKFKARERGFDTKDNELVFDAWDLIKEINLSEGKKGLGELLNQ